MDALSVVLPTLWYGILPVTTPSVEAGTIEQYVVPLFVLLELRKVILFVFHDYGINSLCRSMSALILTVLACGTITVASLSAIAARCHDGKCSGK